LVGFKYFPKDDEKSEGVGSSPKIKTAGAGRAPPTRLFEVPNNKMEKKRNQYTRREASSNRA